MARALSKFSWLRQYARPFPIHGRNVEVLYTPDKYYEAIKTGILTANQRVVLSSLYFGIGSREAEVVNAFRSVLSDSSRPGLHCTLLLDHLRGSRGSPNSRTMLQPLIAQFGGRFDLHLYHTPNLRGLLRSLGPERFNEVMGLQHMKIYLFDNDVLISGANLSRDYYVNRQDRYVRFANCPDLADYFSSLVDIVGSHSFKLKSDGSTQKPSAVSLDPLSSRRAARTYEKSLSHAVKALNSRRTSMEEDTDTLVYPLLQMGRYGIVEDEVVTRRLLEGLQTDERLFLASGYFNLSPQYTNAIFKGNGECTILAASPQANGFYGAKGVAGHVPYMYIHFATKFLEAITRNQCEERVRYLEYLRQGWTYHGKGLWYYLAGEDLPSLTLVGSSNYGHRSLTRDLEAQVAVVTTNQQLRQALHEEQRAMFHYGDELRPGDKPSPDRQLNIIQWIATQFLKPHV